MEQVQDSARQALRVSKRFTKQVAPYAPYITRGLFVATFVEDGVRVLTEMPHQVRAGGGRGGNTPLSRGRGSARCRSPRQGIRRRARVVGGSGG